MRLIVGISGASGVIMGYQMLKALKQLPDMEVHLIITEGAVKNFECETNIEISRLAELADFTHSNKNLAASISSGSFVTDGMIIIPASMKTVAGIASGFAENLLLRAADVCLKENRKVVLVPRELPLSRIHLRNIKECADNGCAIVPPMLTFYNGSNSLEQQIDHIIGKILMQFGIEYQKFVALTLSEGDKPYTVTACVVLCGKDIAVVIGGGEASHIGAAALASPRPSLKNTAEISASASVLCRLGHKDDLPAREAALRLASKFNTNVAVTAGLHIDDADSDDIAKLQHNFQQILEAIEAWLLTIDI